MSAAAAVAQIRWHRGAIPRVVRIVKRAGAPFTTPDNHEERERTAPVHRKIPKTIFLLFSSFFETFVVRVSFRFTTTRLGGFLA